MKEWQAHHWLFIWCNNNKRSIRYLWDLNCFTRKLCSVNTFWSGWFFLSHMSALWTFNDMKTFVWKPMFNTTQSLRNRLLSWKDSSRNVFRVFLDIAKEQWRLHLNSSKVLREVLILKHSAGKLSYLSKIELLLEKIERLFSSDIFSSFKNNFRILCKGCFHLMLIVKCVARINKD